MTLRGSLLSTEDKKRVLIEAGAETGGNLTTKKVSAAIRMLGAGFFQEYTGAKKTRLKTYDQSAFHTEDLPEGDETAFAMDDELDDDFIETLLQEGDEDAILVSEYESAINDTIQDDQELAVALNAYSDARRRLSERFRNRAFGQFDHPKEKEKVPSRAKASLVAVENLFRIESYRVVVESATNWVTGKPNALRGPRHQLPVLPQVPRRAFL